MKESISQLSLLTGFDRRTVTKRLLSAGLQGEAGAQGALLYETQGALRVLYMEEFGRGVARDDESLSPTDRRNLAAAAKDEVQTEILRKERIPLEMVNEVLEELFGAIAAIVRSSGLNETEQKSVIEQMRDAPGRLKF